MSSPWIFLCPSSRGIGHAFTRHLLRTTSVPILATARSNPSAVREKLLAGLDGDSQAATAERLTVVRLDVTDEATVRAAAEKAAELFPSSTHHLRLAFALPGVLLPPEKSTKQVDPAATLESFRVNAVGPLLLMKWFGDFLPRKAGGDLASFSSSASSSSSSGSSGEDDRKSGAGEIELPPRAVWVTMGARVGSAADNKLGGWYSYRASKAAAYSLTRTFDRQLQWRSGDKAMAVAYHPGTVRTALSQAYWDTVEPSKLFEPDDAAEKMADVVLRRLGPEQRGRCWDWKGEEVLP